MTEDNRGLHLPEALSHAAVPLPDEPSTPAPGDPLTVESGPVVNRIEDVFPLVWLGMLTVACVVGIYSAVTNLP